MHTGRFMPNGLCLCLTTAFIVLAGLSAKAVAYHQTGPITVATEAQIRTTGDGGIDSPWSNWSHNNTRYWMRSNAWTDERGVLRQETAKFSGPPDDPTQTPIYCKSRAQLYTNPSSINGIPWFTNVYKDSYGGLLAFVHQEYVTVGGSPTKGRIGLAYSTDNADTFRYLGEILAPYGDPDGWNMQGCPYVVKDGYFYTYYNEMNTTVARAPVADVITAARAGTVSPWFKYYEGGWTQPGMFGQASQIAFDGICHAHAAYSTYDDKYYRISTSMNWGGNDTWVKLWQSSDGVAWDLFQTIVSEPAENYGDNGGWGAGWQYTSIVDCGNGENATVGSQFYLLCGNTDNLSETDDYSMKMWTINLAVPEPTPLVLCITGLLLFLACVRWNAI